jgi:arabinogalactan oligomer/maltooligosaccharide transport system permease protein
MFSRKQTFTSLAFQYTILVLGMIFAVFPIYFVVQASLRPGQQLYSTNLQLWPVDASLENFRYVWEEIMLPTWLWNSIKVAGVTSLTSLFVSISAGYAFSRFRFRGRGALLNSLLALQAFPALLALPAFYLILLRLQLINSHLGLVLIYTCGTIAFNIWNIKGYFDTIPFELEEAAMVDGATPTQVFWHIMLPLARPTLAVTALLGFIAGFGDFIIANTILFEEKLYTAPVGIWALQEDYYYPWGWFAAGALIIATPITILFVYLQKHLVSGLTAGGVKG